MPDMSLSVLVARKASTSPGSTSGSGRVCVRNRFALQVHPLPVGGEVLIVQYPETCSVGFRYPGHLFAYIFIVVHPYPGAVFFLVAGGAGGEQGAKEEQGA